MSAAIGMPAARHTDTFAEGQVQIVELDVERRAPTPRVRRPAAARRDAARPVALAAIIRDDRRCCPSGDDGPSHAGDRVVVVGSPVAAQAWCELVSPGAATCATSSSTAPASCGSAIARALVDAGPQRARDRARRRARRASSPSELPDARVFNTTGLDPDFLEREGIARTQAAIFAMRDDAHNLYAATLAQRARRRRSRSRSRTTRVSAEVYEQRGIDVTSTRSR